MELEFVEYDERFLVASRRWLRDPEIAALTMTPPFTDEDQDRWFASLPARTDYAIWGIQADKEPVGAFGLKHITPTEAEYFGYLGEKRLWGGGHGARILSAGLSAAQQRGCIRVYLRVWDQNRRAVALYRRHGFRVVGQDGNVLLMDFHF